MGTARSGTTSIAGSTRSGKGKEWSWGKKKKNTLVNRLTDKMKGKAEGWAAKVQEKGDAVKARAREKAKSLGESAKAKAIAMGEGAKQLGANARTMKFKDITDSATKLRDKASDLRGAGSSRLRLALAASRRKLQSLHAPGSGLDTEEAKDATPPEPSVSPTQSLDDIPPGEQRNAFVGGDIEEDVVMPDEAGSSPSSNSSDSDTVDSDLGGSGDSDAQ